MKGLPVKFLKDIELFVKLKSDRNSLLELVDKAYGDVCDEISSYLQDLMLNDSIHAGQIPDVQNRKKKIAKTE